jgi:enoyl-CoA hydratase
MTETVHLDLAWAPATALLTFDRPGALNSVNGAMLDDFERAVARLEADEGSRVVVLTGAGRAFVGGGDIAHMGALTPDEGERFVYRGQGLLRRLERLRQISIAAVNGWALGGGLEIAVACDLRIAADTAELGVPEVSVGLIPGWGGTQRLVRLLGRGIAKDLVFTGRRVPAAEALALGLVNRVAPAEALLDTCRQVAAAICKNSPIAVRQAKKAIAWGAETDLETAMILSIEAYNNTVSTEDRLEGVRAFNERRPPNFQGR